MSYLNCVAEINGQHPAISCFSGVDELGVIKCRNGSVIVI
jgi:hypothetical protein